MTSHVVTSIAVSLPAVIEHPGVSVEYVTAPLPKPPVAVSVIAVPTNPLFGELLIVSVACGFKKVSTFATDDVDAYSVVAAFVAMTEHVVFVPLVTVKVSSVIEQRAFAAESA